MSIEIKVDALLRHFTAVCDTKYGDEVVKMDPRDWTQGGGKSFKGAKMSQCPAAFLRMLADTYEYYAAKDEASGELTDKGVPKAKYSRMSAERARAWALRAESRGDAPYVVTDAAAAVPASDFGPAAAPFSDDIPF